MRIRLLGAFALLVGLLNPMMGAAPVPSTYPLGATPVPPGDGGGVVFRVWAPNATSVNVPGAFNSWNTGANALASEGANGIWSGWASTASVGDPHKYFLSGTDWRTDPRSRLVEPDGFGGLNSLVTDGGASYAWQASGWTTPDHNTMVIYELHIGTFSGLNDGVSNAPAGYRDVVDAHVADLVSLGVNMVELMPIHEFAGDRSWGYNPGVFYAPERAYGDPDDLRYLVDTLHQNGIGVILDVVYNHAGISDNVQWEFDGPENIYFYTDCSANTPWGSRPRYASAEVREFITDNVTHWIENYRMDGLRVDATSAMYNFCSDAGEGWLMLQEIVTAAKAVNPDAIIIAEQLPNDPAMTIPQGFGGAGYDAQWGEAFKSAVRGALATIDSGGDPSMADVADAIAFSGFGQPNDEVVKYAQSHDEAGDLNGGTRLPVLADSASPGSAQARGLSLIAGGLTLLSPGVPMLLMGQEFLELKQFGDGDEDRVDWSLNSRPERAFFADLIAYRTRRSALRADSGSDVYHINDAAEVIAFSRSGPGGDVIAAIANFSATDFPSYQFGIPGPGTWLEIMSTEDFVYGGGGMTNGSIVASGTALHGQPNSLDIHLPPFSLLIFSQDATVPVEVSVFGVE